jgi:oligopeptide/dipeptide ABC transporter ATP-binding protein
MAHDALLRVEGLTVDFQTSRGLARAVDDVSFSIKRGETLALAGETGCGKSVTARSILRLVPQPPGIYSAGSIYFRGIEESEPLDVLEASEQQVRALRGDRIAMVFQDPSKALNPALTIGRQLGEVFAEHREASVFESAGLGTRSRGASRYLRHRGGLVRRTAYRFTHPSATKRLTDALDERVLQALADTGVPNPRKVMTSYPHELSGGMKQRVMIAQALACDPDLLIADEPTTALDVTIQARILDLLSELQERKGTAILYITHDLSLVRQIADRLAVMYAGRIAEIGDCRDLLSTPLHPYTQGLMNAIPRAETKRGELAAIPGTVPVLIDAPRQCHFVSRCAWAGKACTTHIPGESHPLPDRQVSCLRFESAAAVGAAPGDMPQQYASAEVTT